jgi:hypothetical protein
MKKTKPTEQDRIDKAFKLLQELSVTLAFQPAKDFGYKGFGFYGDSPDGTRWGIDYNKDLDQVRLFKKGPNDKRFKAVWIEA